MKRIVKNIEKMPTFASRLSSLVDEKCGTTTNCEKQLSTWIDENHLSYAKISHNTLSRYRTGKIKKPQDTTIQALAEFFDVAPEYLKCTELNRKRHNKIGNQVNLSRFKHSLSDSDRMTIEKRFMPDALREFCQHIGYVFHNYQDIESEECIGEYQEIINGNVVTYSVYDTVGCDDIKSSVELPTGEIIEYSSEQFEQILNNVKNYIAFEFFKLKGGTK